MRRASLIATLANTPSPDGAELAELPESVEWLEVSADLTGELDPAWLRSHFKGRLLYSLRNASGQRRQRLQEAAQRYDLIELDVARDLSAELLREIPAEKRLLSWHGRVDSLSGLRHQFDQLASTPAKLYKLVNHADNITEEFLPLALLKTLERTDTIAYAIGPLGFWSRLAALQLGAPAIVGLAGNGPIVDMEPTVHKLVNDYGLPEVNFAKELFAIVGNPVAHSLSPLLHNASYRATNYPALFVPLQVESFATFWQEFVLSRKLDSLGFPINGMTVASPHKEEAVLTAKQVSSMARLTQSANILVRNNGWWSADTTDPDVVYAAGETRNIRVQQKRAAVIGCGGAGRAIAAALVQSGAGVTLINRGAERGEKAASLLGLRYLPLPDFDADGYDIVVNATPVGRDSDETPFKLERLSNHAVVIDLCYGTRPTPLVDTTLARRQIAIDGRDVLLTQVRRQFQMMTGREMKTELAVEILGARASRPQPACKQ